MITSNTDKTFHTNQGFFVVLFIRCFFWPTSESWTMCSWKVFQWLQKMYKQILPGASEGFTNKLWVRADCFETSIAVAVFCLSVCLSVRLSECLLVCLSVFCLPACLSVCPSACLSVCLSVYIYLPIYLFIEQVRLHLTHCSVYTKQNTLSPILGPTT